jgi:tetratricopeptide (TPR) repeat protein
MSASEKVRKPPLRVMCIECPFRALSKPPAMPVVMTHLVKRQEALRHHERALEIRLKLFGEEHPGTAQSLNNIGATYSDLGKYLEALKYLERALAVYRKLFGEEHPATLLTSHNLIHSLINLRRYQDASKRLTHVLANLTPVTPEYGEFEALKRRIHTESIKHGFRPPGNKKKPKMKKVRKGRK